MATRIALGALVACLGLGASGCTERACFSFSGSQGVCPSQQQAPGFFGKCTNIETVDSEGTMLDGACCYDVTKTLHGLQCQPNVENPTGGGFGGRSTSSRVTTSDVNPVSEVSSHVSTTMMSSGGGGQGGEGGNGVAGGGGSGAGGSGEGGARPCDERTCGFIQGAPLTGCLACVREGLCAGESAVCEASSDCLGYEACIANCTLQSAPCIDACATKFPEGASLFAPFIACELCSGCPTACASKPVAVLATCNGTGGGGLGGSGGSGLGGAGQGGAGGAGGGGVGGKGAGGTTSGGLGGLGAGGKNVGGHGGHGGS